MSTKNSKFQAMLASMMAFAGFPYHGNMGPGSSRVSKHNKGHRNRTYKRKLFKPAFTMGFRGFPRQTSHCRMPAPTIDEVRHLERKYKQRLIVVQGLIWFRDKVPFSHEEAERRLLHAIPEPV